MGAHLIDGEFQSDKYPTTPRGKVPLSVKDPTAQDLLWEYASRREPIDAEFSADLRVALLASEYDPAKGEIERLRAALRLIRSFALECADVSIAFRASIATMADDALDTAARVGS